MVSTEGYRIFDGQDPSKQVRFVLSKISPNSVRVLTVPDADGVIALLPADLPTGLLKVKDGVLTVLSTDVTGVELEELTNGSSTILHFHPGGSSNGLTSKCSVYLGVSQPIPSGIWTKVRLDTKLYDTDKEFDVVNNRFVASAAKYCDVKVKAEYENMPDGKYGRLQVYKNKGLANEAILVDLVMGAGRTGTLAMVIAKDILLAAGDILELWTYNGDAVTRNILGGYERRTFMTIHRFA